MKNTMITIILVTVLLLFGCKKVSIEPDLINYNSSQYQKYNKAEGEILENAKTKTKATGEFISDMEICTYNLDSNLIFLKKTNGKYILYTKTPLP